MPVSSESCDRISLIFNRSIAWSKWGSIASIAANGTALELRNLRCHPDDGTWALSEPTITPNFSALDGGPLKHISWSPTGSDLAVIDAAGRVTILSVFSSINKPSLSRPCQVDPIDDLHGVVGCYWLNQAPYPPGRPVRPTMMIPILTADEIPRQSCMAQESKMAQYTATKYLKLLSLDRVIRSNQNLHSFV